jgi:hypothetical protein
MRKTAGVRASADVKIVKSSSGRILTVEAAAFAVYMGTPC